MIEIRMAHAGNGKKVHTGNAGSGASASCMNNSLNGRLHSTIEIIKVERKGNWLDDMHAGQDAIKAWGMAHADEFQLCGKCFKGVNA